MPAAWHSPSVPGSRSCSRTSRDRRDSSARSAPARGPRWSRGTTPSSARRSRTPAGSSSRPRGTRSSRPSRARSTDCEPRRRPSGRSRQSPGRTHRRSGSAWACTWARAGCASGRVPGDPEDYVGIDVNYAARIAAPGTAGRSSCPTRSRRRSPPLPISPGLEAVELRLDGMRTVKDFEEPLPALPPRRPGRRRRPAAPAHHRDPVEPPGRRDDVRRPRRRGRGAAATSCGRAGS